LPAIVFNGGKQQKNLSAIVFDVFDGEKQHKNISCDFLSTEITYTIM
jgi:hypothetical protein